jgi:hypothetical protein
VLRSAGLWLLPLAFVGVVSTGDAQGNTSTSQRNGSSVFQTGSAKGKRASKRGKHRKRTSKQTATPRNTAASKAKAQATDAPADEKVSASPVDGRISTVAGGNVGRSGEPADRASSGSRNPFIKLFQRAELSPSIRRLSFSGRAAEMA